MAQESGKSLFHRFDHDRQSLKFSCVIETGLSDLDKMTITVMKTTFAKIKLKL